MMQKTKWIVRPRPNAQARLRLITFPYAGGGASLFRQWQQELPSSIEVCAVQLPGRENRFNEPALSDLPTMIEALVPEILPLLNLPFAFFGHSMGALISYELSCALRREYRRNPAWFFASGRRAPHAPGSSFPMHQLPDDLFLRLVLTADTPAQMAQADPTLSRLMLPVLRADLTLCETYVCGSAPPLDCPITAFGGVSDPRVGYDELMAWSQYTRGKFATRLFPGDHFFLQRAQSALLQVIANDLQGVLA